MTERTKRFSRRNFLLTVGAGGATTAAAVLTRDAGMPQLGPDGGKHATRGYHATGHINNYYRTTKV